MRKNLLKPIWLAYALQKQSGKTWQLPPYLLLPVLLGGASIVDK